MDDRTYDSNTWHDEPGANTGDARENDPSAPGFTDERDRVFRSQFQHANRSTRTGPEPMRSDRSVADSSNVSVRREATEFEKIETDLENGWLNVRVGNGQWASAPDVPALESDPARQGRIDGLPPAGTTPSHDRASFTDPLPGNTDPTDPGSIEHSM
jgi:hypothetical protein